MLLNIVFTFIKTPTNYISEFGSSDNTIEADSVVNILKTSSIPSANFLSIKADKTRSKILKQLCKKDKKFIFLLHSRPKRCIPKKNLLFYEPLK